MTNLLETKNDNKFEMVLHSAMELPGIRINRAQFLQKELSKFFDEDIVKKAIAENPAQAGISVKSIEHIAKSCIGYEATKVTAISFAAGIPGGLAMIGTVPADVIQYFGHILRILQKLVYLYGWQELFYSEDKLDDGTSNILTLFIGVMFGVNAANAAITKIAQVAAVKVEKDLLRSALTKGAIYPVVKQIASKLGVKMTTQLFSKGVSKAVPFVGAFVSGGVTLSTFLPMTYTLQKYLKELPTADVSFYKNRKNTENEVVDIDFSDIT